MKYNAADGDRHYNTQISVTCEHGYHLNRTHDIQLNRTQRNDDVNETITCEATGQWSQVLGCVPKDCGNPTNSSYLTFNASNYDQASTMHNDTHYGDKANVTCAPGYPPAWNRLITKM
ncbi:hypothetical protein DPMN_117477 [Dreissena polymorpha]|uniref:Sushi domain-containing protein n=1 Tax=Dreissena polymorpha TaxID=45954 RepID=A0A9D4KRD0_DREPO|nr:hypothetical protein DPMN_117477 [Dreissena polymorpha]